MATRWFDAFGETTPLRDAMNRLFEQAIIQPGTLLSGLGTSVLPMNVFEKDQKYVVQAFLPGIQPDDAELTVKQNTLTIRARVPELLQDSESKEVTWLLHEFGGTEITRSVTLPRAVDSNNVEAAYDRGILTIMLPVAEQERTRKISIHAAQSPSVAAAEPQKRLEHAGASHN